MAQLSRGHYGVRTIYIRIIFGLYILTRISTPFRFKILFEKVICYKKIDSKDSCWLLAFFCLY